MTNIPRCKRKHFLPVTLTPNEIELVLNSISNLKHRAILSTIYSAGLRVSEAARLTIADIDSTNMRIFIRQSKGYKDRYTILSYRNLALLREYFKQYRPKEYLFDGSTYGNPHISVRTIQITFLNAVRACGITKKATVHSLRHSFATHMLNNGADILQIKELLGHGSILTTSMYIYLINLVIAIDLHIIYLPMRKKP